MPVPVQPNQSEEAVHAHTVIGWQGIRCILPPEWNLTSFSMDRNSGYLRVDAPGSAALTVQIRWLDADAQQEQGGSVHALLSGRVRKLLRRPEPPKQKPDLKSILEKMLKETAKQAKKAGAAFDSSLKSEKVEGERTSLSFSWTGAGRGQGKIWCCSVCNRIVVAQVVGLSPKDQSAMNAVASQLFATLYDHGIEGWDRWALYDLQVEVPDDFRLEEQKLLSGYLHLVFTRGAERIVVDRWGLANMTLKKFTLEEWLRNHARVNPKRMTKDEQVMGDGHVGVHLAGPLPLLERLRGMRALPRRMAQRYEGGVWLCPETNRIYAVQTLHNSRTTDLWEQVARRSRCHIEA